MIPFSESDGIGASLQRVVCAWCNKELPAQVCVPTMAGTVSHGMCLACKRTYSTNLNDAASPALHPGSGVNGNMTPAPPAVLDHLSHGPVASFSPYNRALFWTVTGYDFARSIRWAKTAGNSISEQIRARRARR